MRIIRCLSNIIDRVHLSDNGEIIYEFNHYFVTCKPDDKIYFMNDEIKNLSDFINNLIFEECDVDICDLVFEEDDEINFEVYTTLSLKEVKHLPNFQGRIDVSDETLKYILGTNKYSVKIDNEEDEIILTSDHKEFRLLASREYPCLKDISKIYDLTLVFEDNCEYVEKICYNLNMNVNYEHNSDLTYESDNYLLVFDKSTTYDSIMKINENCLNPNIKVILIHDYSLGANKITCCNTTYDLISLTPEQLEEYDFDTLF